MYVYVYTCAHTHAHTYTHSLFQQHNSQIRKLSTFSCKYKAALFILILKYDARATNPLWEDFLLAVMWLIAMIYGDLLRYFFLLIFSCQSNWKILKAMLTHSTLFRKHWHIIARLLKIYFLGIKISCCFTRWSWSNEFLPQT